MRLKKETGGGDSAGMNGLGDWLTVTIVCNMKFFSSHSHSHSHSLDCDQPQGGSLATHGGSWGDRVQNRGDGKEGGTRAEARWGE